VYRPTPPPLPPPPPPPPLAASPGEAAGDAGAALRNGLTYGAAASLPQAWDVTGVAGSSLAARGGVPAVA